MSAKKGDRAVVTSISKLRGRPLPPNRRHRSKKDYDRKQAKQETRKLYGSLKEDN